MPEGAVNVWPAIAALKDSADDSQLPLVDKALAQETDAELKAQLTVWRAGLLLASAEPDKRQRDHALQQDRVARALSAFIPASGPAEGRDRRCSCKGRPGTDDDGGVERGRHGLSVGPALATISTTILPASRASRSLRATPSG